MGSPIRDNVSEQQPSLPPLEAPNDNIDCNESGNHNNVNVIELDSDNDYMIISSDDDQNETNAEVVTISDNEIILENNDNSQISIVPSPKVCSGGEENEVFNMGKSSPPKAHNKSKKVPTKLATSLVEEDDAINVIPHVQNEDSNIEENLKHAKIREKDLADEEENPKKTRLLSDIYKELGPVETIYRPGERGVRKCASAIKLWTKDKKKNSGVHEWCKEIEKSVHEWCKEVEKSVHEWCKELEKGVPNTKEDPIENVKECERKGIAIGELGQSEMEGMKNISNDNNEFKILDKGKEKMIFTKEDLDSSSSCIVEEFALAKYKSLFFPNLLQVGEGTSSLFQDGILPQLNSGENIQVVPRENVVEYRRNGGIVLAEPRQNERENMNNVFDDNKILNKGKEKMIETNEDSDSSSSFEEELALAKYKSRFYQNPPQFGEGTSTLFQEEEIYESQQNSEEEEEDIEEDSLQDFQIPPSLNNIENIEVIQPKEDYDSSSSLEDAEIALAKLKSSSCFFQNLLQFGEGTSMIFQEETSQPQLNIEENIEQSSLQNVHFSLSPNSIEESLKKTIEEVEKMLKDKLSNVENGNGLNRNSIGFEAPQEIDGQEGILKMWCTKKRRSQKKRVPKRKK